MAASPDQIEDIEMNVKVGSEIVATFTLDEASLLVEYLTTPPEQLANSSHDERENARILADKLTDALGKALGVAL